MFVGDFVDWTKRALARANPRRSGIAVNRSNELDLPPNRPWARPALDAFENEKELRVVIDAPGCAPDLTRVTWNGRDTLSIYVLRSHKPLGDIWYAEHEPRDWYRQIKLGPELDGAWATCSVKDGVLTILIPVRVGVRQPVVVRDGSQPA